MNGIKRIYVEKKPGFAVEATQLFQDMKENLSLPNLHGLRIVNRYDVEFQDHDQETTSDGAIRQAEGFDAAKNTIFSEPPVDYLYEESFVVGEDETLIAVQYLPGQYDQRADSAMQCMQIVTGQEPPVVDAARIYVCKGPVTPEELMQIKGYCINPVDSREASLQKLDSLVLQMEEPPDVRSVDGFMDKDDCAIRQMREDLALAMSGDDLLHCRNYFRDTEKRNPTETEIRVIDTYWSDHCRHTTFLTAFDDVSIEPGAYADLFQKALDLYRGEREALGSKKDICLMDMAVMGMKALKRKGLLPDLDESEEINACSIVVPVSVYGKMEDWLVMFKNETHNHPTEIEPFGGAATCLGGAIRDPLSGRSYVYQAMRVTGSGDPRRAIEDTLPGKLPQRKITIGAARGYSSYGNQIGLATGQVTEIYDEDYVAKRMEIGAVVGAAPRSHVKRERPANGDIIILVGGRTGRDGCGGATGASKEHTEDSILTCGAEVQKGNPPTERKLQRLFRNPDASLVIKRCNDFGAGGVSVAIGELADGLTIQLDAVPKKYDGLDGTELAISESQERMAVVVAKEDRDAFMRYANEENLEATAVGEVTADRRLVMCWRGQEVVNIARDFLDTNGARQTATALITSPENKSTIGKPDGFFSNLSQLNVAAQKGLAERFDSTIGNGTVLMPFGGKNQLTPPDAMVAKIPVASAETDTVTLMSFGCNPDMAKWSPFHGAVYAIVESITKIVATGGDYRRVRLSLQEYFERMTGDPEKWGKPVSAMLGAFYTQMMLGIPAIGGKDSMSGTFGDMHVPPTLVSFALGTGSAGHVISPEFKKEGHAVVLIRTRYDENTLPDFQQLTAHYAAVHKLIAERKIISAYSVGFGGVGAAVAKMAMGNGIGVELCCEDKYLYSPMYGSFVVEMALTEEEVERERQAQFEGLCVKLLGHTTTEPEVVLNGEHYGFADMLKAWMSPLESVFPSEYLQDAAVTDMRIPYYREEKKQRTAVKIAKPKIIIPVFPGTNCEDDTRRAFEKAGGEVEVFVFRNLKLTWLEESLHGLAEAIRGAQIIALPGGFSAGDEPDGSAKFITAVFRNSYVREALTELLTNRDGLILGICNGFQALLKLGLALYGEIRELDDDSPTLTYNAIGRHVSCFSETKIISNKSPWLWNTSPGDRHLIPVSHGEGRFVADEALIRTLGQRGQIATQYVGEGGEPSMLSRYNPNGSVYAIEGITSPDGRVFGKMGHSERIGRDLYKNVTGEKDQRIFEAGVGYFQA